MIFHVNHLLADGSLEIINLVWFFKAQQNLQMMSAVS